MSAFELIQIVPNIPPAICGVGDHAFALAQALNERHGIRTSFLVTGQAENSESGPFPFEQLAEKSEQELVRRLQAISEGQASTVVLLHFSGYSYASRGLCFWLVRALKRFRSLRPDVPIVTMFHELWAGGSWLTSAVYVQPLQKRIVRNLIRLSHSFHTNRAEYAKSIRKFDAEKSLVALPIFSNFGEPKELPAFESRKNQIVLFQPPGWHMDPKEPFWSRLKMVQSKLDHPEIIVAGRTGKLPSEFKLDVRGVLSKSDASRLLLESKYCYFMYYDGYLGKSSLLGGIAAHGVACIMPTRNCSEQEGLQSGVHYVTADGDGNWDGSRMKQLGVSLNHWYTPHQLSTTADSYAHTLSQAAISVKK